MADDPTVDNGSGTDYKVSADEDGSNAFVQRVKLAYSADGSSTHIPADADGLLVNMGSNNDVTVTSISAGDNNIGNVDIASIAAGDNNIGNVDLASAIPAGTNNIGDVDVLTVPADPFGANSDSAATAGSTGSMQAKFRLMTSQLDSIKTAVETLDNTVAGSELQVDIVSAPTLTVNSHAVTNAGTFAVQVDGSALTSLQLLDDIVKTDDAAFTAGTDEVAMAGFFADEASTDSVDEGDAGAARMTLDRRVITVPQSHAAGGLSIFRSLDLDETEEEIKNAAGTVYGWAITNTATSTRFVKFYNATAANVTVGSTTPVITFGIPGNTSDDIAANALGGIGIQFDTAITVAATTGVADADTGAPGANEVIVNIFYK